MALPATGASITQNQVQIRFGRPSGVQVSLRGDLGPFVGIASGPIKLSENFGGR